MRAPGSAGDKRVKRKRGCRSAAAVAARIERGYLKRTRTAGGTACVNNHVDSRGTEMMAAAIQQLNARLQQQETAVTILTQERERLARQVQRMTGTPDQCDGEIVPRSRGSAVPARVDDDRNIVDTETQRNPRQRRKRTQHTDVQNSGDDNCRSRVGQLSQCRRERRVRGLEAVRDGVESPSFGRGMWDS